MILEMLRDFCILFLSFSKAFLSSYKNLSFPSIQIKKSSKLHTLYYLFDKLNVNAVFPILLFPSL